MSLTNELAEKLALDTINAADAMADPNLVQDVSNVLGASSQTTQEAFMTAVRVINSERRARRYLEQRIAKARGDQ